MAILDKFKIVSPKCLIGTIASGDEFISNAERTKAIIRENLQVAAVEMEGAAIAQVCYDYGIPFVVIRTISDRADHSAAIDFPRFIEEVFKYYSEHMVQHIFASMLPQQTRG